MELILPFAALSMCCAAAISLLPEGSLRKTAMLAMGILLVAVWAEGLSGILSPPTAMDAPDTVLTDVAFAPSSSAQEVYLRRAEKEVEPSP